MIKIGMIILSVIAIVVAEACWDIKSNQDASLIFAIGIVLLEFLGVALIFLAMIFF